MGLSSVSNKSCAFEKKTLFGEFVQAKKYKFIGVNDYFEDKCNAGNGFFSQGLLVFFYLACLRLIVPRHKPIRSFLL